MNSVDISSPLLNMWRSEMIFALHRKSSEKGKWRADADQLTHLKIDSLIATKQIIQDKGKLCANPLF